MKKLINIKAVKLSFLSILSGSILATALSLSSYAYTENQKLETEDAKTEAQLNSYSETESAKLKDNIIEYDEIKALIHNFNPQVSNARENYENNIAELERAIDSLKSAKRNLKDLADAASKENNIPEKMLYQAQAEGLSKVIEGFDKSLKKLRKKVSKTNAPLRIAEDAAVFAAKNIMLNYKSVESQENMLKEIVELNALSFEAGKALEAQGMLTKSELAAAEASLVEARANLMKISSVREQLYKTLLAMCGYKENENINIGEIPLPDLEFIDKINLEEDIKKAIGNNYNLVELRHEKYKVSLGSKEAKKLKESQMEANLRANLTNSLNELRVNKSNYFASLDGFQAAQINYEAVKKQYELGMLSKEQYKKMSLAYIQSKNTLETDRLNLITKIEQYGADVAGAALTE